MSSAAIVHPDGRTVVAHGHPAHLAPDHLGRHLATDPASLPAGTTSTGAPAPRSVVDACAWRYKVGAAGRITVELPAGPGRWVVHTHTTLTKEHAR